MQLLTNFIQPQRKASRPNILVNAWLHGASTSEQPDLGVLFRGGLANDSKPWPSLHISLHVRTTYLCLTFIRHRQLCAEKILRLVLVREKKNMNEEQGPLDLAACRRIRKETLPVWVSTALQPAALHGHGRFYRSNPWEPLLRCLATVKSLGCD